MKRCYDKIADNEIFVIFAVLMDYEIDTKAERP